MLARLHSKHQRPHLAIVAFMTRGIISGCSSACFGPVPHSATGASPASLLPLSTSSATSASSSTCGARRGRSSPRIMHLPDPTIDRVVMVFTIYETVVPCRLE